MLACHRRVGERTAAAPLEVRGGRVRPDPEQGPAQGDLERPQVGLGLAVAVLRLVALGHGPVGLSVQLEIHDDLVVLLLDGHAARTRRVAGASAVGAIRGCRAAAHGEARMHTA